MRILFLESHPMWIYGLPNGFCDLGHEVMVSGPLTSTSIPKLITEFKPDLIISLGWTAENTHEKVDWIRKYVKASNIPFVFWATEDPAYTHCFTLPFIQRTQPDFVFTICERRLDYYRKLDIKTAYLDFGYHESAHHRVKCDEKYKTSIGVVANAYPSLYKEHPEYVRFQSIKTLIKPLLEEGIRVDFWGKDWDRMKPIFGFDIPKEYIHGYISYEDANKVYSCADIVIGIQNLQLSQRTYEILGSEGFLLTYDTLAVRNLFKPGRDLIVSSTPEETIKLVKHYLERPDEREKIRKDGKKAVEKHSYRYRAEYIIKVLKREGIIPLNVF